VAVTRAVFSRPLCIDLYAGLGGWAEGALSAGYEVVGFDNGHTAPYGSGARYPGQLVLQDVLTLHGSQFRDATLIVASPPCQNYSYLAMPWSRSKDPENSKAAKALRKKWETEGPDNRLFDACFRIQREAIEAAGRYIPMVVENVRGAQPWVGRAKANFGSYYLWGDVAMVGKRIVCGVLEFGAGMRYGIGQKTGGNWFAPRVLKDGSIEKKSDMHDVIYDESQHGQKRNPDGTDHSQGSWFRIADSSQGDRGEKVPGFRFDGSGGSFQSASVKAMGQKVPEYSDPRRNGGKGVHLTSPAENADGTKIGGDWFSDPNSTCRKHGSRSNARKAASAQIAKIPFALARYVAESFKSK